MKYYLYKNDNPYKYGMLSYGTKLSVGFGGNFHTKSMLSLVEARVIMIRYNQHPWSIKIISENETP